MGGQFLSLTVRKGGGLRQLILNWFDCERGKSDPGNRYIY